MAGKNAKQQNTTFNRKQLSENIIRKIKNENLLNMVAQYVTALIESGYGMKKYELLAKNIIDMRPLMRPTTHKSSMPDCDNLFKKHHDILDRKPSTRDFFEIVPCFSEGVCQINDDRYIHWSIKSINPTDKTMTLFLMTYAEYSGIWCPETSATYHISIDNKTNTIVVNPTNNVDIALYAYLAPIYGRHYGIPINGHDVVKALPLGWTDKQKALWQEQITKPLVKITKQQQIAKTHNGVTVVTAFINCMTLLNHYLQTNKPKTIRKNSTQAHQYTPKPQIEISSNTIQSDRIIRLVGDIPVHSTEIPKPPTPATVINYKTPAWTTRGHFRHYKSGKTVYIKETVRRRRCMQSSTTNKSVPQTIVKFKEKEMVTT